MTRINSPKLMANTTDTLVYHYDGRKKKISTLTEESSEINISFGEKKKFLFIIGL